MTLQHPGSAARRVFCSYFDRTYAARALTLIESLARAGVRFTFYALCLDTGAVSAMRELAPDNVVVIGLDEFLAADPPLGEVRATRSRLEWYYTMTPSLCRYVLAQPGVGRAAYLDADLFVYSDPFSVASEDAAIELVTHGFDDPRRERRFGRFNVGWVAFDDSPAASSCLDWWRERCLEACPDYPVGGRFGDQKYLDEMPGRFPGVAQVSDPGFNFAPWNLGHRVVEERSGGLIVDGSPLVLFHFSGVRRVAGALWHLGPAVRRAPDPKLLRRSIYGPYLRRLARNEARVAAVAPERQGPRVRVGSSSPVPEVVRRARRAVSLATGAVAGEVLLVRS